MADMQNWVMQILKQTLIFHLIEHQKEANVKSRPWFELMALLEVR